jgi:hypothetical protein
MGVKMGIVEKNGGIKNHATVRIIKIPIIMNFMVLFSVAAS